MCLLGILKDIFAHASSNTLLVRCYGFESNLRMKIACHYWPGVDKWGAIVMLWWWWCRTLHSMALQSIFCGKITVDL